MERYNKVIICLMLSLNCIKLTAQIGFDTEECVSILKNSKDERHQYVLQYIDAQNDVKLLKSLKAFQNEFIGEVFLGYKNSENAFLLSFMDLSDSMKITLLESKFTPDYIKVKLGDYQSEKKVIEKARRLIFDGEEMLIDAYDINQIIFELYYINTKKTKKLFLEIMSSNKYLKPWFDGRQNYKISLLEISLSVLEKYFPENTLINSERRKYYFLTKHINTNQLNDYHEYLKKLEKSIGRLEKKK